MGWTRALVTGASSGIGARIARRLAAEGSDLVLVARSEREVTAHARQLVARFGVSAEPLVADLTDDAALQAVDERLRDESRPVDLLVNNAAFGTVGAFAEVPLERVEKEVRLNVLAVLHLTHTAVGTMQARGGGTILNIASLGAYAPMPYFAVYAATKAFVLHFSLALREELRGSGVRLTTVCPGPVDTLFPEKAGTARPPLRWLYADADTVARRALAGAAAGRAVVLPTPSVPLAATAARLLPPSLTARVAASAGRSLLGRMIGAATRRNAEHAGQPSSVDELLEEDRVRGERGPAHEQGGAHQHGAGSGQDPAHDPQHIAHESHHVTSGSHDVTNESHV